MVNLYVASGVPAEKLKFVVSVTGDGTPAMLNNAQYHRLFGRDNPNLPLIAALREKGVDVSVCDRSVAFHHYKSDWIDKSVTHALPSPTTVSTLENQATPSCRCNSSQRAAGPPPCANFPVLSEIIIGSEGLRIFPNRLRGVQLARALPGHKSYLTSIRSLGITRIKNIRR